MEIRGWAMQAVGQPLELLTRDIGQLEGDSVIVAIKGCGICHTDLGYLFDGVPVRGQMPLILGHEIAGVVEQTGPQSKDWLGKHVVVPAVMPCGECDACKRGRFGICPKQIFPGNDIHGGFASHIEVSCRYLAEVPQALHSKTNELSVIADAVTTPLNAIVRSDLNRGHVAVFVGAGGIGAFGIQIAKSLAANVIAIDIDDERLDLVKAHGADVTLNVKDMDPKAVKKTLRGITKENKWRTSEWRIFETSGTAPGQALSFSLLNFGATLMVVGYTTAQVNVRLSNLMAFEARAVGVWGCPPSLYSRAIDLVDRGAVKIEPFIDVKPMSQVNEILKGIHDGQIRRRVVLTPDFN